MACLLNGESIIALHSTGVLVEILGHVEEVDTACWVGAGSMAGALGKALNSAYNIM